MKLLLIDGNSILNRAFYGVRPLSTAAGLPTNALFGFLNILLKHLEEEKPDRCAVAFDRKEPTFRHTEYSGYKGTRSPMPEDLALQMPLAKELLSALKIPAIEKIGIEADDIIGILSARAERSGDECVIVTGDRDSLQLVSDRITVKLATNKEDIRYNPSAVLDKYGIPVSALIDLKALMGDASDNIPGVKGIGEKTAVTLLKDYGSLDCIFEHATEIKGALGVKLREGQQDAYLSKKLGTILRDGDLPVTEEELQLQSPDPERLDAFLKKTEMPSFYKRFEIGKNLSADETNESKERNPKRVALSQIPEQEEIFLLENGDELLFLLEKEEIGFCSYETVLGFDFSGKRVITHQAKPILRRFLSEGKVLPLVYDTMLAGYILDATQGDYSAERLIATFLGEKATSPEHVLLLLPALKKETERQMLEKGQKKLYDEIELPLCTVLAEMEDAGFCVDKDFLIQFGQEAETEIEHLEEEIYDLAGHTFNINSTKQLGTLLFEEMKLPQGKKTRTGYSTDIEVLEKLSNYHPIAGKIIEYRKLTKLKNTYCDGLLSKISPDGRIHSVFTQTVAQTGRISSTEPNLQNIPIRTALGRELRHAFVADKGCIIADADYSQIELRILSHIAQDETMLNAFRNGIDIHTLTASEVFGLPAEMVTTEMRNRAKAVNFGIVYGIGAFSLAKDLGISVNEAKRYIDGYLSTYRGVAAFMKDAIEKAKEKGYTETLFGRRRAVPELASQNKNVQAFGERVAMNTPIQGTAADIIKIAMIRVSRALKEKGLQARLILQVHDELIVEAPAEEIEEVRTVLKQEMEGAADFAVALTAEVETGHDWFEAH